VLSSMQKQTQKRPKSGSKIYFMNSFTLEKIDSTILLTLHALPIYDFDLCASHARTLLPAALAFVSFGFV